MSFGDVVFATFLMALVVMFAAVVTRHWGLALAHLWIAVACAGILEPTSLVGAAVSLLLGACTWQWIMWRWRRRNAKPGPLLDIGRVSDEERRALEVRMIAEFERLYGKEPEGPDHG